MLIECFEMDYRDIITIEPGTRSGKPTIRGMRIPWTMTGTNNFIAKAFGLVIDCDKMIGGQFEQGLANLKAVVEATAKQP